MQEIFVPALGMASDSVYLAEWLKQPGDRIEAGDVVANVETDKAELEVEAATAGILGRHRFAADSEVPSGATIAVVLSEGESEDPDGASDPVTEDAPAPAPVEAPTETMPEDEPVPLAAPEVAPVQAVRPGGPSSRAERSRDAHTGELEPYLQSPRARRAPDVADEAAPRSAAPASPAAPRGDASAADARYRAAVGAVVSRSWAEIPHFAVQRELRVSGLADVQRAMRVLDPGVTFTDVLVKAYALALMERFDTRTIDIGIAVATERGVSIPVLRDVATADVLQIAARRRDAVSRALENRQTADDAGTPHSTISNLGSYGVDSFTAIVPYGQTSILSVGAAAERPLVVDGALAVDVTMHATLNVDHRTWDGQHAADVLRRLAAITAEPLLLSGLSGS